MALLSAVFAVCCTGLRGVTGAQPRPPRPPRTPVPSPGSGSETASSSDAEVSPNVPGGALAEFPPQRLNQLIRIGEAGPVTGAGLESRGKRLRRFPEPVRDRERLIHAFDDEKPVHTMRITQPFYLGKYEVTQGRWQAVMGNNPSPFKGDANRPVEYADRRLRPC